MPFVIYTIIDYLHFLFLFINIFIDNQYLNCFIMLFLYLVVHLNVIFIIFRYIRSVINNLSQLLSNTFFDYDQNTYHIKRKYEDEEYGESSNTKQKVNHDNSTITESESELESESESEPEPKSNIESGSESKSESGSESGLESESESGLESESESGLESESESGSKSSSKDSDSCPDLGHSSDETEDFGWISEPDDSSHREWFEDIFLG